MASVHEELTAIYREHGALTPRIVVETARPVDHPLHDHFDWNDEAAGEKYRYRQAQKMIRATRIRVEAAVGRPVIARRAMVRDVRAFTSVPYAADGQVVAARTYKPSDELDETEQSWVLAEMRRELDRLKQRYGHLEAFWIALSELGASVAAD